MATINTTAASLAKTAAFRENTATMVKDNAPEKKGAERFSEITRTDSLGLAWTGRQIILSWKMPLCILLILIYLPILSNRLFFKWLFKLDGK